MRAQVGDLARARVSNAGEEHGSAPVDEDRHSRTQSLDFLDRAGAHLEGLDIVPARLARGAPGRVLALGTDVVDGESDIPTAERGHPPGDLRIDLDCRELVFAQVEYDPHVVEIDQADDGKA